MSNRIFERQFSFRLWSLTLALELILDEFVVMASREELRQLFPFCI